MITQEQGVKVIVRALEWAADAVVPIVLTGEGRLTEGMTTDFGSMLNPPPIEGMKLNIRLLLAMGVPEAEIRTMLVTNPSWL